MIIYKTTNLVNNKIYVGKHFTSADDGYLGSGRVIKRAINKYGKVNFEREILEFVSDVDWQEKETFWIHVLSASVEFGNYNIVSGGQSGPVMYGRDNYMYGKTGSKSPNYKRKHIFEELDKMSKSQLGSKNHNWKKKMPEHVKHILYNINKNKVVSEIVREKIRKNNPLCKRVEIDGVRYISISDALRKLKLPRGTVKFRLKSKNFLNYKYI